MRWNVLGMGLSSLNAFLLRLQHAGVDAEVKLLAFLRRTTGAHFDRRRHRALTARVRGPVGAHRSPRPGYCRMLAFPTSKECRPNQELIMFRKVAFTMYPVTDVDRARNSTRTHWALRRVRSATRATSTGWSTTFPTADAWP